MKLYPYPLKDWRKADQYPSQDDLAPHEWAWEFLRRNPEYQRLWDFFDSLPDYCVDRDGHSTLKIGKRSGTQPVNFRFLEKGSVEWWPDCTPGWYADPPPIRGETSDEYYDRTDGEIMPFADYLMRRFCLIPYPIAPREQLDQNHQFTDEWGGDSLPPWSVNTKRPKLAEYFDRLPPVHQEAERQWIYQWEDYIGSIDSDPYKVPILFDVRYPISQQIKIARGMLNDAVDDIADPESLSYIEQPEKGGFPQYRPKEFALHIRLLDADADQVEPKDIAGTLYPDEENGYDNDNRVTKRVHSALNRAKEIRDRQYWLIRQ